MFRPRLASSSPSQKPEGAGSTECTSRTRGTACKKETPQVRRNAGNSLRDGFTAYTRSPRSPGLLASVALRGVSGRGPTAPVAELDPSVGRSGPRDFARPPLHRSSRDTKTSIAPRAPRLVTTGRTSLWPRRDGERLITCFRKPEVKYFSQEALTCILIKRI